MDSYFYKTPSETTRAFLSIEKFDGSIWEPACGKGAISKEFIKAGHQVMSTDLAIRDFGKRSVDFLKTENPLAKNTVTNSL